MPHIILEYSQSLKPTVQTKKVKDELFKTLVANSDFEAKSINIEPFLMKTFKGKKMILFI